MSARIWVSQGPHFIRVRQQYFDLGFASEYAMGDDFRARARSSKPVILTSVVDVAS